ncbi:SNARE associated Golgi protein [Cryptosporidium felis]|nr:SNARE associated Golgi protein [Cryptosporidium felis]
MEENLQGESNLALGGKSLYSYMAIKALLTVLISSFVIIIFLYFGNPSNLIEKLFLEVKESGTAGLILTTFLISILISISIPMEPILVPMAFFLSKIYGVYTGSLLTLLISFSATEISSLFSVLLIRLFLSRFVKEYIIFHDLYSAINLAVKEKGAILVLLIRLTPLVPFSLSNYILGLTEITYLSLFIGNFGSLPVQAILTLLGTSVSSIEAFESKANILNINPKHGLLLATVTLLSMVSFLYIIMENYRKIKASGYIALKKDSDISHATPFHNIDNI